MASLNIKNEETHRKARELAKLTGESVTTAVGVAIDERLEREQRSHKKQNRLEWLLQLSKETSALMNDGRTSKELIDELYDPETGLPV
jgi:antitoxin VapB